MSSKFSASRNLSSSCSSDCSSSCCISLQESDICHVAYALNAKKLRKSANLSHQKIWSGGGLADILTDETEEGVSFKPFDFDLPLENQPFYHVIIHKITEDIRQKNDVESQRKVQLLQNYLLSHPTTRILDPINFVENVITRSRVCNILQTIITNIQQKNKTPPLSPSSPSATSCLFSQPKYLIVTNKDKIHQIFSQSNLRFPVICKPIEACGTPNSHSMVIAMSHDGLSLVDSPCIIQEYWDHSASFYKVYVIDEDVMVYRRPSLPDIQQLSKSHTLRSIIFDSRFAYPTLDDFVIPDDTARHLLRQDREDCEEEDGDHCMMAVHTPVDSNDISPIPYDLTIVNMMNDSLHSLEPFPLSSCSSTCSSSQDIEFHYPFDDLNCDTPTPGPLHSQSHSHHLNHSTGGGYVHHTPLRGLKPGASPNHKFHQQSQDSLNKTNEMKPHNFESVDPSHRITQQVSCHQQRFQEIALHLKKGFGLTLFGFDVLIPNQSSSSMNAEEGKGEDFLIIDVNFFPSYKEVHDFPTRLRKMLRKKSAGLSPSSSLSS